MYTDEYQNIMQRKSKQRLKRNDTNPTLRYMASRVRETKMNDAPRSPEKLWILKI